MVLTDCVSRKIRKEGSLPVTLNFFPAHCTVLTFTCRRTCESSDSESEGDSRVEEVVDCGNARKDAATTPGADGNGRIADSVAIVKPVDAGTDAVLAEELVGATVVPADDDCNKVAAGAEEDEVEGGMRLLTAGVRLDVPSCSGENKINVPMYGHLILPTN